MGFATGKAGDFLSELKVGEADGGEGFEPFDNAGDGIEPRDGFFNGHFKCFSKIFPFVMDFERDGIEARAVACFARDSDSGEELEVDGFVAEAPAGAAHAPFVVGTEVARLESFSDGSGEGGVEGAEEGLDFGVGGDIGTGRLANG